VPSLKSEPRFVRRHTVDREIISICPRCFQNAAVSRNEAELEHIEREHICPPESLKRLEELLSDPAKRTAHYFIEFPTHDEPEPG
jgi:hypothetical protein